MRDWINSVSLFHNANSMGTLPDENPHRTAKLSRRITLKDKGDSALYVCVTQEDGHLVWSSPIYVFR